MKYKNGTKLYDPSAEIIVEVTGHYKNQMKQVYVLQFSNDLLGVSSYICDINWVDSNYIVMNNYCNIWRNICLP